MVKKPQRFLLPDEREIAGILAASRDPLTAREIMLRVREFLPAEAAVALERMVRRGEVERLPGPIHSEKHVLRTV